MPQVQGLRPTFRRSVATPPAVRSDRTQGRAGAGAALVQLAPSQAYAGRGAGAAAAARSARRTCMADMSCQGSWLVASSQRQTP